MSSFDPQRLLATLNDHGVEYVVVGGLAAIAHGSALPTEDVDVAPRRDGANLERLAAALRHLEARVRTDAGPGIDFPIDAAFLAAQPHMLNLVTAAGDLDLTLTPAGFPNGYDDLAPAAVLVDLGDGPRTKVASLADVIASKTAAGRAKDHQALPHLHALLEELGGTG